MTTGGGGRGEGDVRVDCTSGLRAKTLDSREEIALVQWHVGLESANADSSCIVC